MYFLLAGIVHRFVYLKYGLAVILAFVGSKMLAQKFLHIPIPISLAVIALTLGVTIAASLWRPESEKIVTTTKRKTGSIFGSVELPARQQETNPFRKDRQ